MEAFLARKSLPSIAPPPDAQNKKRNRATEEDTNEKKRKRRKSKQKEVEREEERAQELPVAVAHDEQNPPADDESAPISTADFLSAIVAAATATSGEADARQAPYAGPSEPVDPSLLLNDLSNESVVRALQEMGVNGLTDFIKAFNEAQSSPNAVPPPDPAAFGFVQNGQIDPAFLATLIPPPLGQRPVSAGKILGKTASTPQPTLPPPATPPNPEDAYLLATKWLSTSKLDELVRSRGLVYKKGKFSNIEEQQLDNAIENYRIAKGLTYDQLLDMIFQKQDKDKDNSFWSEITLAVPLRPIISVYHHVRRKRNPLQKQGKWMPAEDDKLREAVASMGQQWEKVSLIVGRRGSDCRDRWRNHISGSEERVTGKWSKEEEEKLIKIVEDMTVKRGKSLDDEVFWGNVSALMGNKRNRQQCRIKWTDCLSKIVKKDGSNPRWNNQDAYILVHKLDSLNVRDDTEIDWRTLGDEDWNHWSAHALQRRWLTMKRSIKGHEEMTFREIMEILKAKKTHFEVVPKVKRKAKKGVSAETVES
ncbi:RNA polymerase I enhancer binding protein [Marasmius tenuissimus]|uniref:RNA polymerase I enhancer binding protein n=1 Tax=Marasmius tenuissimus TaxID=585030 RepID=A0ABR3A1Z9_9AGAR|nr:RNA polymerase I enhancer binding protein [Marasmius tenuissimus]